MLWCECNLCNCVKEISLLLILISNTAVYSTGGYSFVKKKKKILYACLNNKYASLCLFLQDRSVCVAVSALRPLLFDNGDVLVVGSFSAVTVAHISVAAAARSGRVLVCGADLPPLQIEEIQELLTQMDVKSEWWMGEKIKCMMHCMSLLRIFLFQSICAPSIRMTFLMLIYVHCRCASLVRSLLWSGWVERHHPAFKGHHSSASVFVLRAQWPCANHPQWTWRYVKM